MPESPSSTRWLAKERQIEDTNVSFCTHTRARAALLMQMSPARLARNLRFASQKPAAHGGDTFPLLQSSTFDVIAER